MLITTLNHLINLSRCKPPLNQLSLWAEKDHSLLRHIHLADAHCAFYLSHKNEEIYSQLAGFCGQSRRCSPQKNWEVLLPRDYFECCHRFDHQSILRLKEIPYERYSARRKETTISLDR